MGDKYKPKRRGLLRCLLIPCISVVLMLLGFVVINFKFLSVDLNTAQGINTHYQESIPQIPVVPYSQHAILPNSPLLNQQQTVGLKKDIVPIEDKRADVEKKPEAWSNQLKNLEKVEQPYVAEKLKTMKKFEEMSIPKGVEIPVKKENLEVIEKKVETVIEEEKEEVMKERKKVVVEREEVVLTKEKVAEEKEEIAEKEVEERKEEVVEKEEVVLMKEKVVEEKEEIAEKEEVVEERKEDIVEKKAEEKMKVNKPLDSPMEKAVTKSNLREEIPKQSEAMEVIQDVEVSAESSCANTPLSEALKGSSIFKLSDFDCSVSNEGWREHLPPPPTNSSRAQKEWSKRMAIIDEFAQKQDHYDFDDEKGKYIVFWPIFAGIGNNLAVFSEVLLIAVRSNRKFLVYDWDALREYFYLPFQYEVITEKVWERDPDNTLIVEKTNQCPFNTVDLVHEKVDARFVVFRSTCLTAQQLIKNKNDKRWFSDRGITAKILVGPQETLHHIYRWLYAEVMTPRPFILEEIEKYKRQFDWDHKYMVGVHVRTGGVNKEVIQWGRFLNEKDVQMFKKYALQIQKNYEKGVLTGYVEKQLMDGEVPSHSVEKFNQHYPVGFYVLSDQDSVKSKLMDGLGESAVTTRCDMTHTNVSRKSKDNPGFICALIENYLLSSSDILVLTTRSTYGYLARHRTNVPFIAIDLNSFDGWKKLPKDERSKVPVESWSVNYMYIVF